ncbi:hypothetical protein [Streptomyces sp. H34-S4]|uniref:hypothetical protein n=1 Tax=Streptomyces sp. H34-S4 TaxID=2996463 RepID=UPI00226E8B68|nr:hypothetical protein [Streptomyces sp. H34-S4]MCY0935968.1 hypothetical protein [Streptomyces sp. H34-S4]
MTALCTTTRAIFDSYLLRALPAKQSCGVRDHLDACTSCWNRWNIHRWDRAAGSPLLAELRTYLEESGLPYTPMRDSSRELAESWYHTTPSPTSRADFFRSSEAYLYNLTIWQASGNRPPYVAQAEQLLARHDITTITDLGCGIASDTLDLAGLGYSLTPVDYDSPSTRFARWRLRRAGHDGTIHQPGLLPQSLAPEALWAIDTLDHIPDLDTQLGPLLSQCRLVITETQQPARSHGNHRYYIRRTSGELNQVFAAHNLHPQPPDPRTPNLCVWSTPRSA